MSLAESETIAPLKNVAIATRALEATINRPDHLPGIVAMYAYSGWGKTLAATYAANKYDAHYVECRSAWTRKALLLHIAQEIGLSPAKSVYELIDQIAEQLVISQRPLIIDEMDNLLDHSTSSVEIIRDLYEASQATIMIIGEEALPGKLEKYERFHNRVLEWVPAQPCDIADTRQLAKLYCKGLTIDNDLLDLVLKRSDGAARRICVNLERIRQFAKSEGLDGIDLDTWGTRQLYTGAAPKRRTH